MSLGGGPVTIAVGAMAALGAAGVLLTGTYEKIDQQERALTVAAKDHGIALADMDKHVEAAIRTGEQYAFSADDVRGAIAKLTEAGMSLADQQSSMPAIMDLARAKNLSLADATRMWELALMGNTRAVKDLGIALPKVTTAQAAHDKAQKEVTHSSKALTVAQDHLKTVEASLAGKHHLTAAQAHKLKLAHDHVTAASKALKTAQDHLSASQSDATLKASRLKQMDDAVTKAVGDQRSAVTPLQQAQTTLGNQWERLAKTVGPGLEDMFTRLIRGLSRVVGWVGHLVGWFGRLFGAIGDAAGALGGFLDSISKAQPGLNVFSSGRGFGVPHAAGGWVGLHGPELGLLGEKGPEYIVSNDKLGGMGGGGMGGPHSTVIHTHIYLDGRTIAEVVDRHLGTTLSLRGSSRNPGLGGAY